MENEACQETEKFLYGSFFSTSLFVFFYLVRLEPYSTMGNGYSYVSSVASEP